MKAQPADDGDTLALAQAATWMARLWSEQATDQDRSACAAWRAQQPEHERAWQALHASHARLDGHIAAASPAAVRSTILDPGRGARQPNRRRALQGLGLFVATVATGYGYHVIGEPGALRSAFAAHRTGTGEVRDIQLPDGTQVTLDTASAIDLYFSADERRVRLLAGRVHVTTAHDPAARHRPFVVQTRQGLVRALGTRFTVRQEGDVSHVAVLHGAVELAPIGTQGNVARLDAGQQASLSMQSVGEHYALDDAAAWTQGTLMAERMRLADLLAELGRYRQGVLRCDARVAELRVSGVFPLRDTDRALANLTLALPVEVVRRTRWWVTVQPLP
ncbi:FecR domain-containing protein [Sphaerotilus sp.]|uniref:FecR domain-containing protein n=1 Tax=Sphaerotilus sp. TaxID=2093942 RepID=UPI002ACD4DAC|nr:FecR domain-containing protein [Sphaerotilus sp.]MDZ7855858.1 FecR domain-containing protein [Sphaerotilus sp.]